MSESPRAALDIDAVLGELTLEEKASLLSGKDFWFTKGIERVAVPSVMVTDGPHGLRRQDSTADHLGIGHSVPATCFPTAAALGSSWDVQLLGQVGSALGVEAAANDVAVILGPGINIKRSPLCGRNFEYFSEDPVVSGELGAALINGIQSKGVGTSLKHFAANNQETDRMRVSSDVDEQTLREIYLAGFERAVTTSAPTTVMCPYNKINGVYASQDPWLLTGVLRDEWGFDGVVISDWGAVRDRVAALEAGLDLEMPATGGRSDAEIVAAVRAGRLDEAVVDTAVRRWLGVLNRTTGRGGRIDVDAHHTLARRAAADGCVLLRNEPVDGAPLLPLTPGTAVAVVGEFARTPRYQGAGSSQVNPTRVDSALESLRAEYGEVSFSPGFTIEGGPEGDDASLAAEAVELAEGAHTLLFFAGLPGPYESEGFDRTDLELPANQLALLDRLVAAGARIVVVLANGGVVTMSWRTQVTAIVEVWLGGQAGGSGVVDVLTGAVNPSGKLTETIPERLTETPAYGNFPGEYGHVRYGEGLLVGYRWYDKRRFPVAYPFGHGLSYTTFAYTNLSATVTGESNETTLDVAVTVSNTGPRRGAEVVQLYVGNPHAAPHRPERELKDFTKIDLDPGESATHTFHLIARDLASWHPVLHRWVVEGGELTVAVGASSRDLRGELAVAVIGEDLVLPLHEMSTVAEAMAHPIVGPEIAEIVMVGGDEAGSGAAPEPDMAALLDDMPLRTLVDFGMASIDSAALNTLIAETNAG